MLKKGEAGARGWRDTLPVHPACELLPELSPDEIEELGTDIKLNGLRVPLVVYTDPQGKPWLLDGRSRLDALKRVGIGFTLGEVGAKGPHQWSIILQGTGLEAGAALKWTAVRAVMAHDIDPYEHVLSLNVRRRHLTAEQKRNLIETLLKRDPGKSDRQIGKVVGAHPTTVGTVRREAEERGSVSKLDTRVDAKGRQQPAHKTAAVAALGRRVTSEDVAKATSARQLHVKTTVTKQTVIAPYYTTPAKPASAARTLRLTRGEAEDPAEARNRAAATEILRGVETIVYALAGRQIGEIVAALDDEQRQRLREGRGTVDQLWPALDAETNVIPFPN